MAKWDKKLDEILKNEKDQNKEIRKLADEIINTLHGYSNIGTENVINEVKNICEHYKLSNCEIDDISVKNTYANEDEKTRHLTITIILKGRFNGTVKIKTSPGHRREEDGKVDIYYVNKFDCEVRSELEDKIEDYYKGYLDLNTEKFVDLVFDKNAYINYDSRFRTYELWDSDPGYYADCLKGYNEQRDNDYHKKAYEMYKNLKKVSVAEKISKFAYDKLRGKTEQIEWMSYYL